MPEAPDGQSERRSKHPWADIRADFVTNGTSVAALSKKFKCSERQITRHSVAEGWVQLRHEHVRKLQNSALAKAEEDAEWKAEYLAKGKKAAAVNALLLLAITQTKLSPAKSKQGEGKGEEPALNASEIRQLAAASNLGYRNLCEALGVAVIPEMGTPDVELPDDPLDELDDAVLGKSDTLSGKNDADSGENDESTDGSA